MRAAHIGPASLVAFAIWGALTHGVLFGAIALCCAALACLPSVFARRWALPRSFAFGWMGLLIAHVALGMGQSLYQCSAVYDKFMHFLAFAWVARMMFEVIGGWEGANRVRVPAKSALILLLALGLGACWELFEFAVDQLGLFVAQPGLYDTMMDFVCDGMGALSVVVGRALVSSDREPVRARPNLL